MRRINKSIRRGLTNGIPDQVWYIAHDLYPKRVADVGLYCAAFFGHGSETLRKCDSVWRGCVREAIAIYTSKTR